MSWLCHHGSKVRKEVYAFKGYGSRLYRLFDISISPVNALAIAKMANYTTINSKHYVATYLPLALSLYQTSKKESSCQCCIVLRHLLTNHTRCKHIYCHPVQVLINNNHQSLLKTNICIDQQVMQLKLSKKKQQLATIELIFYSSYWCGQQFHHHSLMLL